MIHEGQIILFKFPQTDQVSGKLRPALVLRSLPGSYEDWLICMITTRLSHENAGIDEIIKMTDADFSHSGLKAKKPFPGYPDCCCIYKYVRGSYRKYSAFTSSTDSRTDMPLVI